MNWREVEPDGSSPREKAWERAERVLRHPDIARHLCDPPLSLPDPRIWSGYIPPALWREQHNDSPVRAQLIAICKMVVEREKAEAASGRPPVAPELITEAQLTKLHTCLTEYGIEDRQDKLDYLGIEVGHMVASSKDLTKEEASVVIDTLDRLIRKERAENGNADDAADAVDDQGAAVQHDAGDLRSYDHPRPDRGGGGYGRGDDGPSYPPVEGEEDIPPY